MEEEKKKEDDKNQETQRLIVFNIIGILSRIQVEKSFLDNNQEVIGDFK